MFSKRLREVRKERGYTQEQIANYLGFARPTYTAYETGRRKPDNDTLVKIAKFLNVSTDYLLGKSNIRNPADEIADAVKEDPELADFWNVLREREDLKLLFKQTKKLEPKEIQQIIRIIKAIEDSEANE